MTRYSNGLISLVLAGLLAGCGGGGGGGGTTASTAPPTTPVTTVAPGGTVSSVSGSLTASNLSFPEGLAVSPDGSTLYVANTSGNSVTEINLTNAGYPQTKLQLWQSANPTLAFDLQAPAGLVVSPDSKTLYVANFGTSGNAGFIAAVNLSDGVSSQLAYSGAPGIDNPTGLAVSSDGTALYIANHGGQNVMQGTTASPYTSPGYYSSSATPINPWDVLLSPTGATSGTLYVSDNEAGTIGTLTVSAGAIQPGSYKLLTGGLDEPTGMAMIGSYLYIASYQGKLIDKIDPITGAVVETLDVTPHQPFFLATDGTHLFFTDGNDGSVDEIVQP